MTSSVSSPAMERFAHAAILLLAVLVAVIEVRGLLRPAPGDTISEWVWPVMLHWPGAFVCALCAWLLWHFPFGRGRGLSWIDLLVAVGGVALWLIARNNPVRP